jgi:hypothetical protein
LDQNYYIQSYAHIKNGSISIDGKIIFNETHDGFSNFIKAAYKSFETQYSKFFKMDNLSKLAFLGADILLNEQQLDTATEHNIAIVFSNKASSLDTDRRHQDSISDAEDYFPSPAVFVYTLPNICIGEISIRHKLFSENSFFIFDHFNADYLSSYTRSLLETKKAESVLCGWVEYDNGSYEAFLYLVGEKGKIQHTKEEILRLYTL